MNFLEILTNPCPWQMGSNQIYQPPKVETPLLLPPHAAYHITIMRRFTPGTHEFSPDFYTPVTLVNGRESDSWGGRYSNTVHTPCFLRQWRSANCQALAPWCAVFPPSTASVRWSLSLLGGGARPPESVASPLGSWCRTVPRDRGRRMRSSSVHSGPRNRRPMIDVDCA